MEIEKIRQFRVSDFIADIMKDGASLSDYGNPLSGNQDMSLAMKYLSYLASRGYITIRSSERGDMVFPTLSGEKYFRSPDNIKVDIDYMKFSQERANELLLGDGTMANFGKSLLSLDTTFVFETTEERVEAQTYIDNMLSQHFITDRGLGFYSLTLDGIDYLKESRLFKEA